MRGIQEVPSRYTIFCESAKIGPFVYMSLDGILLSKHFRHYSLVCYFGSKYLSLGPSCGHNYGCIKNFQYYSFEEIYWTTTYPKVRVVA